ncbi:MAG: Mov34/MPN/PAD-1 family protein [Candidatus Bathyarchaeia archaeon]
MILRLTSEQLRLLRDESRKNHPVEACALLFGRLIDGEAVVTRVVVTPNVLKSSIRFEANPQSVFNAFEQADRDGLQFIGSFHSHPAPASPSAVDIKYMRLWGEAVWLILSSINGNMAAFQMTNGNIHKVTLKVEAV